MATSRPPSRPPLRRLPSLEDSIEIVLDSNAEDFGRARVRTADRRMPQQLPGLYQLEGGMETDDYDWLVEDGFFGGKTSWNMDELPVLPNIFPPVDLTPCDGTYQPTTAPSQPTIFEKPAMKFEQRRTFLRSSARLLRVANIKSQRGAKSRSPSPAKSRSHSPSGTDLVDYFALSSDFYDTLSAAPLTRAQTAPELLHAPMAGKSAQLLAYMKNGPQETVVGLDNVPVLKQIRHKFDPAEVEKAHFRRLYGEDSVMNVRHDSEFMITPDKAIPVDHITTILYRNSRKYGSLFDQKALKRRKKRGDRPLVGRTRSVFGEHPLKQAGAQTSVPFADANAGVLPSLAVPSLVVDQAALAEAVEPPLSARKSKKKSVFEKEKDSFDIANIRASFLSAKQDMAQAMKQAVQAVEASSSESPCSPAGPSSSTAASRQTAAVRQISPLKSFMAAMQGADPAPGPAAAPKPNYSIQSVSSLLRSVHQKHDPTVALVPTNAIPSAVAFSYTHTNKLQDVHLKSQLPKQRPLSASKLALTAHQSFHLAKEVTDDHLERSLMDLLELQQRRARSMLNPRKDLTQLQRITSEEAEAEREALIDLFDHCDGPNWVRNDNWCDPNVPVKHWFGVGCTVEGYVFEINLPANNLRGSFPDVIWKFRHLETVFMDSNQLYGTLPDYALQKCQHLQIFSVQNNQMRGEIVFDNFCDLKKIRELWLTNNEFEGEIQLGVCKLTSLTHLSLAKNRLEGRIPAHIGKLSNLLYLSFAENQLTGRIPQSLIALHQLQTLSLHNNRLTGRVPDWLFALTCLEDVHLFNNQFENNHETLDV